MMYLPLIVACAIGEEISPVNCTYYSASLFYETELECSDSVTRFLGGVGMDILTQQNQEITNILCVLVHDEEPEPTGDPT